MEINTVVF